jgi:hypothetical protein
MKKEGIKSLCKLLRTFNRYPAYSKISGTMRLATSS